MVDKIFRVSGFLLDKTGARSKKDIISMLKSNVYDMRHFKIEEGNMVTTDIAVSYDENCDLAECQKYFNNTHPMDMGDRKVVKGEVYKHFKGKLVTVIAISQDSEAPGRFNVVYECETGIFNRPYDMFISEVDHVKYPNVKQKYRFEKVEV